MDSNNLEAAKRIYLISTNKDYWNTAKKILVKKESNFKPNTTTNTKHTWYKYLKCSIINLLALLHEQEYTNIEKFDGNTDDLEEALKRIIEIIKNFLPKVSADPFQRILNIKTNPKTQKNNMIFKPEETEKTGGITYKDESEFRASDTTDPVIPEEDLIGLLFQLKRIHYRMCYLQIIQTMKKFAEYKDYKNLKIVKDDIPQILVQLNSLSKEAKMALKNEDIVINRLCKKIIEKSGFKWKDDYNQSLQIDIGTYMPDYLAVRLNPPGIDEDNTRDTERLNKTENILF